MATSNSLPPPRPLSFEGNLAENWRRWIQQFRLYLSATGSDKKDEKVQCSILLTVAGEDAVEVFNTFTFTETEEDKIEPLIAKFRSHCTPKKNITFERHMFNTRCQESDESIDSYVTALKKLAKSCEFGDLQDSLVRDRIVCGIQSAEVKARLLRDPDLTLEKAINICRTSEISKTQLRNLDSVKESTIHAIKSSLSQQNFSSRTTKKGKPRDQRKGKPQTKCSRCGYDDHELRNCPANGQTCHKCKGKNHFAKVCRSSVKPVHVVEESSDSEEEMYIGTVTQKKNSKNEWNVVVKVGKRDIALKLDTGAQCNVMPYEMYQRLTKEKPIKSKTKLVSYSGHNIKVIGKNTVPLEHKGKFYPVEFQIAEKSNVGSVLGLQTCLELNLIKRVFAVNDACDETVTSNMSTQQTSEEIINEYDDVFQGLGCLEGEYHIKTNSNVTPVVHAPRKVPYALRDKLKTELDRMENLGVIERVVEPTEWVNSLVVVEKNNGKVRVCLDPRDLNKAILREHYPMKTIEEVAAELSGAKVFSTIDASSGFWQIRLDEESSRLVTFNSPFGRYKFLRLPFGINSAPEVFQRRMTQALDDIEGVAVIVDDILVWGTTVEEHNRRLQSVLQRARELNLKLNKEKSKIQTSELPYIGHLLTRDGVKPDPLKVTAIKEINAPEDKKELQRFMGMVNYLAKFIPNLSNVTVPLRELLKKDTAWHWEEIHQKAFQEIKRRVTEEKTLQYYDVSKPVVLSVDSSSYGLGACLLQDERPVSYASRSLNSAEKNYAQIEKELLAILFGCTKYHQYIYSKSVTVETDHKPLEYLFKKPLTAAPPRLQRMMLSLQKYDLTVQYKPGKSLYIADTLSRAPSPAVGETQDQYMVHTIENLPISNEKIEEFQRATNNDPTLQTLQHTIQEGWPDQKSSVEQSIREYWPIRDEISCQNGLLLRGERLIVPSSMRNEMLRKIHENHLGIEKCKRRARDLLYWPGMNSQIHDLVSKCNTCLLFKNKQQREPMKGHKIPDRPWQRVGIDLFELDNENFMVISDYYSKFFEITKLPNTKSLTVISHLKPHFGRYGIPDEIVSDNGPQFASSEFQTYTASNSIRHTTSSPRYPQSNGLAERTVQTAKKLLKKAKHEKTDPNLALLDLRNTPIEGINLSPVQMLMGRRTRTRLPMSPKLLEPMYDAADIKKHLQQRQEKSKRYYDRGTKDLHPLYQGQHVRMYDEATKQWKPAVVCNRAEQPRSYTIETETGQKYRRNRRDIMKNPEKTEILKQQPEQPAAADQPRQETDDTEQYDKAATIDPTKTVTRSGRTVKTPERYGFEG